jgi:hypothetical protein
MFWVPEAAPLQVDGPQGDPAARGPQTPSCPLPFKAAVQPLQVPGQLELQQTLLMQLPEAQSVPTWQRLPFAPGEPHEPIEHVRPASQS